MCNSFFSHLQFFPHLWLIWKSSTVCRHSKTRTLSLFSVSLLLFPEIETKLPFSATVSSVDFGIKYRYYITHVHRTCAPLTPQEEPISCFVGVACIFVQPWEVLILKQHIKWRFHNNQYIFRTPSTRKIDCQIPSLSFCRLNFVKGIVKPLDVDLLRLNTLGDTKTLF